MRSDVRGMPWLAFIALPLMAGGSPEEPGAPGPWHVGWEFESHGGFPLLPTGMQSWQMNRSAVGYFLGNASGPASDEELLAESRMGIVGLGWQLSNIPGHHSNLEQYELEQARRLKAVRPDVKVLLTRNTEVTTVFYNMSFEKMFDPNTQDFWLQCGGKPCQSPWISPAGNTPKYFFNFSNPRFVDWWLNDHLIKAVSSDLIDGLYFDCSCSIPPGTGLDQQKLQADAQVAIDRAIDVIGRMGKWIAAWSTFDGDMSPQKCAEQMRLWIPRSTENKYTFQMRAPGRVFNQTLAAFLIARGPSAVYNFPTLGTYGSAIKYGWSPLMDADYGVPLETGVEGPVGVFTRRWSNATITLDCNMYRAEFDFAPARSEPDPLILTV